MAGGFSARGLRGMVAALALAGCVGIGTEPPPPPDTPEAELALRAQALQRTVQEAAVAGAVAGAGGVYIVGGKSPAPALGLIGGIPIGVATGTYVGYLQQQYASNEARLERLRSDIELTNAETAAAIRTMRVVLADQQRELEAIRAGAGGAAMSEQVARAETDLANMNLAVNGAEKRLGEFNSTRSLQLVEGQITGVDAQIGELSQRIAEMRQIAGTLAAEI
jgi:hypothetical protein